MATVWFQIQENLRLLKNKGGLLTLGGARNWIDPLTHEGGLGPDPDKQVEGPAVPYRGRTGSSENGARIPFRYLLYLLQNAD